METAIAITDAFRLSAPRSTEATIGDLVVVRTLSQSRVGEVLEARDQDSGLRCVVKRLLPQRDMIDGIRFLREAEMMKALHHPNLMPVLHADLQAQPPFYVMPLRDGETLADKLARGGRLGVGIVTRIARDVLSGLAA